MTIFNKIYLFVFNHFKAKYKHKANTIALYYISFLQICLVFLAGFFLAAFLSQMNTNVMSQTKAITLFCITSLVIHFSNWMAYSGKSRKEMNAKYLKQKPLKVSLHVLALIPFIALVFSFILSKSI